MSRKRRRRPPGTVPAGGPRPPADAPMGPDDLERPADDEATPAEGYGSIPTSRTRDAADATAPTATVRRAPRKLGPPPDAAARLARTTSRGGPAGA